MRTAINRLKELDKERQFLIRQLEMWASVEEQGINPDDVDSFTLLTSLFSKEDKKRYDGGGFVTYVRDCKGQFVYRPLIYNCVTLKNGFQKKLDPMIVAP